MSCYYRSPSQTNFLEILNATFEIGDIDKKEIYILSDFNINIYYNNKYIAPNNNTISSKSLSYEVKIITNSYDSWLETTNSTSDSCN